MIVYEVIEECSISYPSRNNRVNRGFVLYKGDFFFIESNFYWIKKENIYTRSNGMLVKIHHNKLVSFGDKPEDIKKEWTWIEDINLIEPIIYIQQELAIGLEFFDKISPFSKTAPCKNVTDQWKREEKLNKILIDK